MGIRESSNIIYNTTILLVIKNSRRVNNKARITGVLLDFPTIIISVEIKIEREIIVELNLSSSYQEPDPWFTRDRRKIKQRALTTAAFWARNKGRIDNKTKI